MINKDQAVEIARLYAKKNNKGWDERYYEVSPMTLKGEPVWMITTSDIQYSESLPWMIEHMPNPAYYYISMVEGHCIGFGTRKGEIEKV